MAGNKRQQRRARQVRRTNQRAAQRMRRPPTVQQLARQVVRERAEFVLEGGMLQAEIAAADLCGVAWREHLGKTYEQLEQLPAPELAMVRMLATLVEDDDPVTRDATLALVLALQALGELDDVELHREAGEVAGELRARGARDPQWAARAGRWRIDQAWIRRDPWNHQPDVLVGFVDDATGAAHTLVAMADQEADYQLVGLHVDDPINQVVERIREGIGRMQTELAQAGGDYLPVVLEQVQPALAGGQLHAFFEATWELGGTAIAADEDARAALSIFHARFDLLKRELFESDRDTWYDGPMSSELDELPIDELLRRLVASDEVAAEPDASERALAEVVDAAFESVAHRAQFGPLQVDDWVEVEFDGLCADLADDPDALRAWHRELVASMRAWARFAARHAGVDERATDEVLDVIEQLEPRLLQTLAGAELELGA